MEMYKLIKYKLGYEMKVLIVFNKVDVKFTACRQAELTNNY